MKDEVPPALIGAHVKMVEEAVKDGQTVDGSFGLEKSGIAGTASEKEEKGQRPNSFKFSSADNLQAVRDEVGTALWRHVHVTVGDP